MKYVQGSSSVTNVNNLNIGWNIISLPVQVQNDTVHSIFPICASNIAFAYNGSGYVIKNRLNVGTGYWLKFSCQTIDTISGLPLTFDSVSVTNGWNLIGSLSSSILDHIHFE